MPELLPEGRALVLEWELLLMKCAGGWSWGREKHLHLNFIQALIFQEEFPEYFVVFILVCVGNALKENVAYIHMSSALISGCFLDFRSGMINFKNLILVQSL